MEFTKIKLGNFLELKRGYDLPRAERKSGNYPIISSSGVSDFHAEMKVCAPGVVTGRCGTIGQIFFIEKDFWPLNTALYVRDFKNNDPRFTYYLLQTLNWEQFNDKSGVPGINRNDVHQEIILAPHKATQKKIADFLGTLDDKIAQNRQMNETLEEMAQALFRDWFVDFGPTRRQMDGATDPCAIMGQAVPPEKAATLAPLFPDKLGKNGLPEEWGIGCLNDWANSFVNTVQPKQISPSTRYIGLEHMPRGSICLGRWETSEKIRSNKNKFLKGQVMFGKLRPYFHKVGIAPFDGICSTDIVVVDGKEIAFRPFVATLMSSDEFVSYTSQNSTGTKMPRTSWKLMRDFDSPKPSSKIVKAFGEIVQPFHNQIVHSIYENHTLAELRDLLLPKLMSGEISIADAEAVV